MILKRCAVILTDAPFLKRYLIVKIGTIRIYYEKKKMYNTLESVKK